MTPTISRLLDKIEKLVDDARDHDNDDEIQALKIMLDALKTELNKDTQHG